MKYFTFVLMLLVFLASCSETETENEFISVSSGDVIMTEPSEEVVVAEIVEEEEEALPALDLSTAIFSGNGTEPFWGFNASGSTLILREPSDTGPMDLTTFTGVVMTNVGTSVSMTAPGMSLNLVLGTCSDGMSDIVYDYSSSFVAGPTSYTGCANVD